MPLKNDIKFMKIALALAKRGVGLVAPNPSVGCVLVKDGQIIAVGNTGVGGRPHAEAIAIKKAGKNAKGATAYVTLEPCCHIGKTPPCTDALIKAGVEKVVVATGDPYEKVAGGGIKRLREAGIKVVIGVCEEEARTLNEGFFSVQEKGRPYVTLKLATSADGKIADSDGNSKWITGEDTRAYAHYIRAKNDAIMVGIGTVLADDPMLNCRLPGMEWQSPVRVVMDRNLRIPLNSNLVKSAGEIPLIVITSNSRDCSKLEKQGVKVVKCDDVSEALGLLAKQGITRLMVEGGSKLAKSFAEGDFVDELVWMKAPKKLGKDGIDAIDCMDISQVADKSFTKISEREIGDDVVSIYKSSKSS